MTTHDFRRRSAAAPPAAGADAAGGRSANPPIRRRLLVAALGAAAALVALPATGGLLDLIAVYLDQTPEVPEGLDWPVGAAVSPDGRHVYVTGLQDDALVVFARDATREALAWVETLIDGVGGVSGLDGPYGLTVSPDGRHVFTTGILSDSLAVFARDASGDQLAFVEAHFNGVGGVFGLGGADGVAASADDRNVYATGTKSDSVAVFARDASTDHLTFVEALVDGVGGVGGIYGVSAVTVGRLDRLVFTTSAIQDSLVSFERSPTDGTLTPLQLFEDGVGGVDGLDGADGLVASADGEQVYVAGGNEDAIAVFGHRGGDLFSPLQVVRNGVGGVQGLVRPARLALTPDGAYLIATAQRSQVVALFERAPDGTLTFLATHAAEQVRRPYGLAVSPDGLHALVTGTDSDSLGLYRLGDAGGGDGRRP